MSAARRHRRLVLVPGLGLSAASWRPVLAALPGSAGADVQLVELPGHGERSHELPPQGVRPWVEGLDRALSTSGEPAVVVAFSFGTGVLARRLVRSGTTGVAGCLLVGGVPGPETFTPAYTAVADDVVAGRQEADERFARLYAARDGSRRAVARDLARVSPAVRRAATGLPPVVPPPLDVPTTVVFGAQDAIVVPPGAAAARRVAREVSYVEVPGGGHAVHLDEPSAVASLLDDLLHRVRA